MDPEGEGKLPLLPWAPPLLEDELLLPEAPLLEALDELELALLELELLELELLELELLLDDDEPLAPELLELLLEGLLGGEGICGVVGLDALGQPASTRQAQLNAIGSARRRAMR